MSPSTTLLACLATASQSMGTVATIRWRPSSSRGILSTRCTCLPTRGTPVRPRSPCSSRLCLFSVVSLRLRGARRLHGDRDRGRNQRGRLRRQPRAGCGHGLRSLYAAASRHAVRMTDETHSLPADFGGGIAPSSHGVIANNAIEGANGYGVWVNARGQHSAKFPDGSAGPTIGAVRLRPVSGCEA